MSRFRDDNVIWIYVCRPIAVFSGLVIMFSHGPQQPRAYCVSDCVPLIDLWPEKNRSAWDDEEGNYKCLGREKHSTESLYKAAPRF